MISVSLFAMVLLRFCSLTKCSSTFAASLPCISRNTCHQSTAYISGFSCRQIRHSNSCSGHIFSILQPRVSPTSVQVTRQYQTALQSTSEVEAQTDSSSEQPEAKAKPKSRKQRKRDKIPIQRIDKVLADRGLGTRSKTFELAKSGRIATADSPDVPFEERTVIKGPSQKIRSNAILFIDGKLLPGPTPLLMAYHKPKFMLSVMQDEKKYLDQQRRHLGQVLLPRYVRSGMHPVGRLDYDTSGLILFSSDGKLTNKLLHPKQGIEKEYVATVQGDVNEEELKAKLAAGVETTEGVHTATLLEVMESKGPSDEEDPRIKPTNEDEEDEDDEFDGTAYEGPYSDVRLLVTEGKYRMVRRMLHNCGHSVVELRRERHGAVRLDDLKVGEFREANEEELAWAKKLLL